MRRNECRPWDGALIAVLVAILVFIVAAGELCARKAVADRPVPPRKLAIVGNDFPQVRPGDQTYAIV